MTHQIAGIALAGDHVWQDSPLGEDLPRTLLPVAQSPLLAYSLAAFRRAGAGAAGVCANGNTRAVRRVFGAGEALDLSLLYYEDGIPRGPAGCIHDAAQHLAAELFLVAEGSTVPAGEFNDMLEAHAASDADVTIAVAGAVDGQAASRLNEPCGAYVISRAVVDSIPSAGFQDLKEGLLPRLIREGRRIATFPIRNPAPRLNDYSAYLALNEWVLRHARASDFSAAGYAPCGDAWVHHSAQVDASARLLGRVLVGPGVRVERDAVLIGAGCVGADCVVESGAILSRTILWDRVRIGAHARLDQCIAVSGVAAPSGARYFRTLRVAIDAVPPGYAGGLALPRVRSEQSSAGNLRRGAARNPAANSGSLAPLLGGSTGWQR